jgi:anion-transporting  ArsA/GET3 family ATPase
MSFLSRRLNIVTGKGGVGKSTLAAAMALAAQRRGLRVLVCECSATERIPALLGVGNSGPEVRRVDTGIWHVHVRPAEAMREYALMVLRFKTVYSAVFENRLVRYFLKAIPQLPEIVMLGKVWWHVVEDRDESGKQRWDMVIFDAPATGHALSLLGTPRTILEIVNDGPMVRDMKRMQALVTDPALTAAHLVTLPEEMPANEAVELHEGLAKLDIPMGRLFLNAWFSSRFSDEERHLLEATTDEELAPSRVAARTWGERQEMSAHHEKRLREAVPMPMTCLPYLATDTFGRAQVEELSRLLTVDP